jgi:hypothetical protein
MGAPEGLMLWSDEQRAMGERMIVEEHGHVICMGYARFGRECDCTFDVLCERVAGEVTDVLARVRITEVQPLLCELIETLDPGRLRYVRDLERA